MRKSKQTLIYVVSIDLQQVDQANTPYAPLGLRLLVDMNVLIKWVYGGLYSVAAFIPVVYVARGGRFWIGVGVFWAATILISFGWMILGLLIELRSPELSRYFDQGDTPLVWFGLGWLPGMLLSAVGGGLRLLLRQFFPGFYEKAGIHNQSDRA
jgi:hypothetical protein